MKKKLNTEFLKNPEVMFMIKITSSNEEDIKLNFNIEGNAFIIHEMVKFLMRKKPYIKQIFEYALEDLKREKQ